MAKILILLRDSQTHALKLYMYFLLDNIKKCLKLYIKEQALVGESIHLNKFGTREASHHGPV